MARIVRKYGHSSLHQPEDVREVAKKIADLRWNGHDVVIVASAMASTTDELLAMADKVNPNPPRREIDMLLSVGERIACSLLALAIEAEGVSAVSYTGSQVGIITDDHHGEARIVDVRPTRLLQALDEGKVVVVAGFQGVSINKEITTLGRGGSDATAVAIAAAIKADRCELVKDVDGLYTAHPDVVSDAEVIESIDYDSALRLARGGTKALQSEAARLARDHHVPLAVGRDSNVASGTIITDRPFDCGDIVGIARQDGLVQSQGTGSVPSRSGWRRVVQTQGRWILWENSSAEHCERFSGITVVTSGRPVEGLFRCINDTLSKASIPLSAIHETESDIWICLPQDYADNAVQLLHNTMKESGWIRSKSSDRSTDD